MKKQKLVTIQAPAGSLIIVPNQIRRTFKKMFKAGADCGELHPDDDTYDSIHFDRALKKIIKAFSKKKIS